MKCTLSRFIFASTLVLLAGLFSTKYVSAQLEGSDLVNAISTKNFAFTVTHETSGDVALGNYYLHVINDSLSAVLPYAGHSTAASYTSDETGINLNTREFTYLVTVGKNGNYNIKITLNHDRFTNSFSLRVNKKGIATLVANGIGRENSVYTGVIQSL